MDQSVISTPKALSDNPYSIDLLGYNPYVEAMSKLLGSQQLQTPFVVGVYGAWGTGKSTFMRLVNSELTKQGLDTVFFHPWQFEEKEEVWKALIFSVISYLEGKSDLSTEQKNLFKTLFIGVGKLALDKSIKSLSNDALSLDDFIEVYANVSKENADFVNTFRLKFGELKNTILESNEKNPNKRLVVFVDDLDRCTPENAIMVIESIKLFFDQKECVFILGIDREVVQKGIEFKYKDSVSISGRDYLEKIVQLPFTLPPIADHSFEKFVNLVTDGFDFPNESIQLLIQTSDKNPRRVKRLSNCLHLVTNVAEQLATDPNVPGLQGQIDKAKLALLLVVQVRFPLIYHWWSRNPMTLSYMKKNWEIVSDALTVSLKPMYGEEESKLTVKYFSEQIVDPNKKIQVSDFSNETEASEYFAITGIVEEVMPSTQKNTEDFYDKMFSHENNISSDDTKSTSTFQSSALGETDQIDTYKHDTQETINSWDGIRTESFTAKLVGNLTNHIDNSVKYLTRAKSLSDKFKQAEFDDARSTDQARELVEDLSVITPKVLIDQLNHASIYMSFIYVVILTLAILFDGAYAYVVDIGVSEKNYNYVFALINVANEHLLIYIISIVVTFPILVFRFITMRKAKNYLYSRLKELGIES